VEEQLEVKVLVVRERVELIVLVANVELEVLKDDFKVCSTAEEDGFVGNKRLEETMSVVEEGVIDAAETLTEEEGLGFELAKLLLGDDMVELVATLLVGDTIAEFVALLPCGAEAESVAGLLVVDTDGTVEAEVCAVGRSIVELEVEERGMVELSEE